ncbi:hypothetical protein DFJ68_1232 [Terracoccus luteus]|uniref:Uncharacterized protein n=1 Tax=Terracoccus luteus TaxID=53356 RepID=A0A495XY76_9MICO|nr:hypothetical protein [Terracoccus luteus]RKT77804.1 hypothetical protein DFJ68_1232 [Terracoccus luteus]
MPEPHTSSEPPVDPGAHPAAGDGDHADHADHVGATDGPPSVAREAARLLEVLSAQGYGRPASRGPASGDTADKAGTTDASPAADSADRPRPDADAPSTGGDATTSGRHTDHAGDHDGDHATDADHECTCGGRAPAACAVCPVCQVLAVVQRVSPETIDRLADFAAFAADALRDVAERRRGPKETP